MKADGEFPLRERVSGLRLRLVRTLIPADGEAVLQAAGEESSGLRRDLAGGADEELLERSAVAAAPLVGSRLFRRGEEQEVRDGRSGRRHPWRGVLERRQPALNIFE